MTSATLVIIGTWEKIGTYLTLSPTGFKGLVPLYPAANHCIIKHQKSEKRIIKPTSTQKTSKKSPNILASLCLQQVLGQEKTQGNSKKEAQFIQDSHQTVGLCFRDQLKRQEEKYSSQSRAAYRVWLPGGQGLPNIIYEEQFSDSYEQQCDTKYEKKCETQYETQYETKYKDQCKTEYDTQCETKYEQP